MQHVIVLVVIGRKDLFESSDGAKADANNSCPTGSQCQFPMIPTLAISNSTLLLALILNTARFNGLLHYRCLQNGRVQSENVQSRRTSTGHILWELLPSL